MKKLGKAVAAELTNSYIARMDQRPSTTPDDADRRRKAAGLAARLDPILAALWALVDRRITRFGLFARPLRTRLARAHERLVNLLVAIAAGRLPRRRAPSHTPRPGGPRPTHLPRRHAWLVATLGHQAAAYRSQLESLLRDPETQATLAAAITHAPGIARTLRPLCRMLGIPLPPPLQRPARPARPRPQPAPKPPRPPLPPCRPIYPQRHPRPMPFLRLPPKLSRA